MEQLKWKGGSGIIKVRFICIGLLVGVMSFGMPGRTAFAATKGQHTRGLYDVRDYGAAGDGVKPDTKAIQAAIDACTQAGGGRVYLSNGTFLSGGIKLKNNVALYVEGGTILLASRNKDDYTHRSLVYAEKADNISIAGRGIIDGHGAVSKEFPKVRKHPIHFVQCKNVKVQDVILRNSTTWIQHYFKCDNLVIDGVTVDSRINPDIEKQRYANAPGRNEDGLNINSCQQVRISNCVINSDDDGIVLKSTSLRPCRNVTITNCIVSSNASAIKFGTESGGGFQNITVGNCTIYDTRNSGIALEIVDGGTLDRINISNITMRNVKGSAIFIRLGNRGRLYERKEKPGVGKVRNIMISNVQASEVGGWIEPVGKRVVGCHITGLPGFAVEDVTLSNIRIRFKGGGTAEDANREIPERPEAYPSCRMYGTLPAYGFYVRHAKSIEFHHVDLGFDNPELRPAMVFDDVEDLEIFDFDAESTASTNALIWLKQVRGAFIHGCSPRNPVTTFVRVDGNESDDITLLNNNMINVKRILETGKQTKKKAAYPDNNRTK